MSNILSTVSLYATPALWEARNKPKALAADEVIDACCDMMNISRKTLLSASRKAHHVRARHYVMLVLKKHTTMLLAEIGRSVGRRDHTTVVHALQSMPHRIQHEEGCAAEWYELCNRLQVMSHI